MTAPTDPMQAARWLAEHHRMAMHTEGTALHLAFHRDDPLPPVTAVLHHLPCNDLDEKTASPTGLVRLLESIRNAEWWLEYGGIDATLAHEPDTFMLSGNAARVLLTRDGDPHDHTQHFRRVLDRDAISAWITALGPHVHALEQITGVPGSPAWT